MQDPHQHPDQWQHHEQRRQQARTGTRLQPPVEQDGRQRRTGRAFADAGPAAPSRSDNRTLEDGWSPAGPVSAREQRATRAADRDSARQAADRAAAQSADRVAPTWERGKNAWVALAVLIVITLLGSLIDSVGSFTGQDAFNVGIVLGSVVAILMVKRSQMFWVVVAPPLVYAVIAVVHLYIRSSGSGSHSAVSAIINTVQDYLVFGFPALAAAVAAVLIVAGVRMARRS